MVLGRQDVKTREKRTELKPHELSDGRTLMVKAIEPEDFLDLIGEVVDEEGDVKKFAKGKMAIELVRYGAADEQGNRLFESSDEVLGTLSLPDIGIVAGIVTDMSGLSEVGSAKKNSTAGDSLPSDSPNMPG